MPRRLSRFQTAIVIAFLLLGVRGKHVRKRNISDVKCYENGRFYRYLHFPASVLCCACANPRATNPRALTFATTLTEAGGYQVRSCGDYHFLPRLEKFTFARNPDRAESTVWTRDECAKYYLCLDGEVFEFRCSTTLLFDVNRQLCDMQQNVHNCEMTTETRIPKPLLETAACANETHIACADANCIPAEYFCDGSNDCADASDEGWCDANYDPNSAEPCDLNMCQLPDCFCSKDGNEIPGNLVPSQTPQMVTITFNGAVNHENWDIYSKYLFTPERRNPNGCPIKATFFISHLYTNYRHIQKLWNDGHEIAVNSITHRGPEEWWSRNATVEDWFDEMVGQANIIHRFGKVRMEDFRGLRVPYLSVGWNRQFLMMQEFGFVYDATVVAPLVDPPLWPYTLDYKMPHTCSGNNQHCPTRSYAGLWEMVINPLSDGAHTCATIEYCPSTLSSDDVYDILMNNFKRHYSKNRAPFGIHLDAMWLKNSNYLIALKKFFDELLTHPDVYFVTYKEVIEWIKRPTPVIQLKKFKPWQCKDLRFDEDEIACGKPNTCKLPSKVLGQDKYMITCMDCPKTYPWIRNEFGFD